MSAVQDLLSLCTRNFEVMYCPGEEPVDGACPVCRCNLPEVKRNRADHIHSCRCEEFMARDPGRQCAPALVQFQCSIASSASNGLTAAMSGKNIVAGHLTSTTPKWCSVRVYRHTVISPGFCPFCLRHGEIPAAQRLKQWPRNCTLMAHVEAHVEVRSWAYLLMRYRVRRRKFPLPSSE